jgi:hypothetical protein
MQSPVSVVRSLGRDPDRLTTGELRAALSVAATLRGWLAGRESRLIRELDRRAKDSSDPAKDTAGQVGRGQNLDPGQAKRKTRTAKELDALPETQAALEQGEISEAHADALADARAKADATAKAALGAREAELLAAGAKETPGQFRDRLAQFVKRHSADDGRSEFDRKRGARRLSLWRDKDGMTQLRGSFDPVAGQLVRSTLDRVAEQLYRRDHRNHPEDEPVPVEERTNEQRMADAFSEVCRRADQVDGPAKRGQDRAVVFLSLDDLLGRLDAAGIPSTLADGTPIPASVARRLACDSGLIPMVLGGDSVPLDEGRAKRDPTPAQRLAVGAQYSTCMVGDCTAPFAWTELHHVDPFHEGAGTGRTDLDNLIPACDHDHHLVHTPGWTVGRRPDGTVITTAPDGTRWEREPNGPAARGPDRSAGPPTAAAPDPGSEPAATLFVDAA